MWDILKGVVMFGGAVVIFAIVLELLITLPGMVGVWALRAWKWTWRE